MTAQEITGLVSVIIPVYNGAEYLPRCIESVASQSYKNLEMILIDDGSTDNSLKICQDYSAKDPRIKTICSKNKGPASARNLGLNISRGEFISFVDADDTIDKDALTILIRGYNKNPAEIVIGDFRKIKKGIVEERRDIIFPGNKLLNKHDLVDYSISYLKKPNKNLLFAVSWARLFKSSVIRENEISFNPELHTFEDVDFNFKYLKHTDNAYFIKQVVYNHTVYDSYSSATMSIGNNPKKLFGYRQALVCIGNFLRGSIDEEQIKREIGHASTSLSIIQLVRACGQINSDNREIIYGITRDLINDSSFREGLQFYSPSKGESKVIPFLMKLKLVSPIIQVCKYKAHKRYKPSSGAK